MGMTAFEIGFDFHSFMKLSSFSPLGELLFTTDLALALSEVGDAPCGCEGVSAMHKQSSFKLQSFSPLGELLSFNCLKRK
jgi:hypothetical protein